jgi:hypothetical protein
MLPIPYQRLQQQHLPQTNTHGGDIGLFDNSLWNNMNNINNIVNFIINIIKNNNITVDPSMISRMVADIIRNDIEVPMNNEQEAQTILECEVCDLSREALCSQITELTYEIEDYRNAASTEATCCICFDKPRIFINTQCGHLTSCISCVHQLNNQCPICRKVGQFIKIIAA